MRLWPLHLSSYSPFSVWCIFNTRLSSANYKITFVLKFLLLRVSLKTVESVKMIKMSVKHLKENKTIVNDYIRKWKGWMPNDSNETGNVLLQGVRAWEICYFCYPILNMIFCWHYSLNFKKGLKKKDFDLWK